MQNYGLRLSLCVMLMLTIVLTGCMVGPDFHSPKPPQTDNYTNTPLPSQTVKVSTAGKAGKAQHFIPGQEVPADWWALFHSTALDNLIRAGLANNPNLSAAQAALRQAEETYNSQVGALLYPSVNTQLGLQRERLPGSEFGTGTRGATFDLYNVTANVAYTLDVFGGARRELEALRAQVDYQQFEIEATYITLTANIVTTAITAASFASQIEATKALIQSQADQLDIVTRQLQLGGASRADVLTQQSQLAATRATLPPLEQSLSQSQHALAVLIGTLPSDNTLPSLDLNQITLPTELPISLPSSLVEQRPDIRASEALLHAASANIGVATANLFPQITLSGNYGWDANSPSTLFRNLTSAWDIGGGLTQPIFNGGSLRAKRRAAIAGYQQAEDQYRQTVLQAFQNVADSLRAVQHDAETFRAQKQAEVAAKNTLHMTTKQFKLGGVSYLSLLTAERQYQQAKIGRIQAQAARYNDTAALFLALGGGWWNCKLHEVAINGK